MPIQWHGVTAMSIDEVENQQNNDLVQTATNLVEKLVKAKDKKKSKKSKRIFDGSTEVFANKIPKKTFETELEQLQIELVKMQYWIKHVGYRVVVIFEGRDAAGKGGVIKRIADPLNPRGCRVVALGTPSNREKTQW
ncbi:MAG: polyphosphate kinase 2, partial [Nostoc sp.]